MHSSSAHLEKPLADVEEGRSKELWAVSLEEVCRKECRRLEPMLSCSNHTSGAVVPPCSEVFWGLLLCPSVSCRGLGRGVSAQP